jgi:hypothetical protein
MAWFPVVFLNQKHKSEKLGFSGEDATKHGFNYVLAGGLVLLLITLILSIIYKVLEV